MTPPSRSASLSRMISTPATTPWMCPAPPKIETPPSSTAAMTLQLEAGRVVAAGARVAERPVEAGEGGDDPETTNSQNLARPTWTPDELAASVLKPMARGPGRTG